MADDMDIPMPRMMPAGATTWRNAHRREGLDSSTGRLMLAAGVIGGGLLLMVGAWSLTGHRNLEVPVVEADARPIRTLPENPGGLQLAGQDDAILSGSSSGQDAMAPPPEAPAPQALRQTAELPGPVLPMPAAPSVAAPNDLAPSLTGVNPTAPSLAAPAVSTSSPSPPDVSAAMPVEPEAVAAPAPSANRATVASAESTAETPVARTETARAAAAPDLSRIAAGPQVQLAALKSEQAALGEWDRLMRRMPELLGGRAPTVMKIARADGKVFFRLRTSGFPDIAHATSFCEKVRAKGASCALGA